MLFFPEGTRSRNGQLQPFKAGAFRLAADADADIVPITLQGASDLLPKGSITPSVATVRITIHPHISSTGKSDNELMEAAQAAIASALPNA
jgi:1-acyl-sn-glycerol-3-phosphate acyltransferase